MLSNCKNPNAPVEEKKQKAKQNQTKQNNPPNNKAHETQNPKINQTHIIKLSSKVKATKYEADLH